MRKTHRAVALGAACAIALQLSGLAAGTSAAAGARAPGQRGILAAADAGARVFLGRTGEPRKLDTHGYVVELEVDQALTEGARAGQTVRIAWEELSASRAVRFANGERVLVCLEPLPTSSIWRKRLPTPAERGGVLLVANRGMAFARAPGGAMVHALDHYVAMARPERESAAGLAYVVDLVASAPVGVAEEALEKLAGLDDLATRLAEGSQRVLVASAADAKRPEGLRMATLAVAGERRLAAARAELVTLAAGTAPTDAGAWMALARIDGRLPEGKADELLGSARADLRVVGVVFLQTGDVKERVASLVEDDPSARVRFAAVDRLLEDYGEGAIDAVLPALDDPDDQTRTAAAAKIGSLGASVVPRLVAIVDDGPARASDGAIVALSFAGPEGNKALRRIHHDHADERTRTLAGLALGRFPGHEH